MGPYRRQSAKHHHVKPYQNHAKQSSEERQASNSERRFASESSTTQMVESPISMTLNVQIAIKTLGIDALRELMTNVILPAAEASFTKEQKAEIELRFKEQMIVAQEVLATPKFGDKMDETEKIADTVLQELINGSMGILPEERSGSATVEEVDTKEEEYDDEDEDDLEEDESEEEPDLDPQELREVESKIAYASHNRTLRMQLKIFHQSVRMDWKDGWEEQWEMMREMLTEIGEWCQDLFETAFIKRVKLSDIDECLQAMHKVMEELRQSDSRTEFDEGYVELQIYHKKRRCYSVHSGPDLLVLFWRDLALTALTYRSTSLASFAENIIEEIPSARLFRQLKETIRPELTATAGPSINTAEATDQEDPYQDHWYSEDMKAALPRLRKIVLDIEKWRRQAKRAKKQTGYAY